MINRAKGFQPKSFHFQCSLIESANDPTIHDENQRQRMRVAERQKSKIYLCQLQTLRCAVHLDFSAAVPHVGCGSRPAWTQGLSMKVMVGCGDKVGQRHAAKGWRKCEECGKRLTPFPSTSLSIQVPAVFDVARRAFVHFGFSLLYARQAPGTAARKESGFACNAADFF